MMGCGIAAVAASAGNPTIVVEKQGKAREAESLRPSLVVS